MSRYEPSISSKQLVVVQIGAATEIENLISEIRQCWAKILQLEDSVLRFEIEAKEKEMKVRIK